MKSLTPMVKQYLEIKSQYPDAILFYRIGDFYEMFFEDAQVGSKELDIVLTSRDKGNKDSVPLCGVPHHAADTYITKLLEKGYKVAVCEQVEDPKVAKGIVKRDVIRVFTPGLVTDSVHLGTGDTNTLSEGLWSFPFDYRRLCCSSALPYSLGRQKPQVGRAHGRPNRG